MFVLGHQGARGSRGLHDVDNARKGSRCVKDAPLAEVLLQARTLEYMLKRADLGYSETSAFKAFGPRSTSPDLHQRDPLRLSANCGES